MYLHSTTKVQQSPMILKEGILANNDILDFDEFYDFMRDRLNEDVLRSLLNRLNSISGYIKREDNKRAYLMWENLEQAILANDEYAVSLLFIENINSPAGQYNYSYATKEYDVLGDRGKLSRLSQLNKKLFQESLEEQINEHLLNFITDIENKEMKWKFIQQVFKMDDHDLKKQASEARWRTHNWTYRNILYGQNPSWYGNAADAFMNHMAHMHVQLIAGENDVNNKELFATSVFNEEKDNIFNLLYASTNKISWLTGGDIIIKYQNQIYNIQLKTGQKIGSGKRRSRIGGKLAVQDLLNFIEKLKLDIKTENVDGIIKNMYNELQTSGWIEFTNNNIDKTLDEIVKFS